MKSSSLLNASLTDLVALVKGRWPAYIWYTFGQLLMVGALMVSMFLFAVFFGGMLGLFMSPEIFDSFGVLSGAVVVVLVFVFLLVLIQNYFTFGLYRLADSDDKDMSLHAFHTYAIKKYWSTFGNLILLGLMVLVIGAVGAGVVAALAVFVHEGVAAVVGVLLGLVAIYYGLPLAYAWFRILLKGERAVAAYQSSQGLIAGRWWKTLGVSLLVAILSYIPVILASFFAEMIDPRSATQMSFENFESFAGMPHFGVTSFLMLVLMVIVTIFPTYAYLALYRALEKTR